MGGGFFSGTPNNELMNMQDNSRSGFFSGGMPGMSSNQYGPTPMNTPPTATGGVPAANPSASSYWPTGDTGPGGSITGAGNVGTEEPVSTGLQDAFNNYLKTQIGQGVAGYGGSTVLPSTGQATAPGTLNAPMTPTLEALQQFFMTGNAGNTPGLKTLGDVANKGISALPAWDAMVKAQQQNIQQNAAQLREQFNSTGDLSSSPFATGMQSYYNQATLNQNALLSQMQLQGMQEQLSAATTLEGAQQALGQVFQGMDQQAIQNTINEFIRTSPEYNPILNILYSAANTYAPVVSKSTGVGIGAAVGSGIASAGSAIAGAIPSGSSTSQPQPTALA